MPVKLSLELVPPASPDTLHMERERFQYTINECDRVLLRVERIDLQGPDSGRVVNRRVLIPLHRLTTLVAQA